MTGRGNPSSDRQVSDLKPPMTTNESAPDPTAGERPVQGCMACATYRSEGRACPRHRATPPADDASTEASEPLTEADVSALVGDDIDYWLGNPFMTPDLIADKVRWWVTTAATKARAGGLIEAADEMEVTAKPGSIPWSDWLRDRAARIARGDA